MSFSATPVAHVEPAERRRSTRVSLEMALQIVIDGEAHPARTVLANRQGVVVYSLKLCQRGSIVDLRNPATGRATRVRVAWSWVEQASEAKTIRLALERVGADPGLWDEAYEERLREESLRE
jgi:hypothetical protein